MIIAPGVWPTTLEKLQAVLVAAPRHLNSFILAVSSAMDHLYTWQ